MGATSDDIIRQANQNAMKQMGVTTPTIPPSDPNERHQFILNQYNQSINPTRNFQQQKELLDIINESHSDENNRKFDMSYFKSPDFTAKSKSYTNAKPE